MRLVITLNDIFGIASILIIIVIAIIYTVVKFIKDKINKKK